MKPNIRNGSPLWSHMGALLLPVVFGSIGSGCDDAVVGDVTAVCGDGRRSHAEQCDTDDYEGATCESLGFAGGTLACSANCAFDTSACTNNDVTTLRLDGGLSTGQRELDGKVFVPLLPFKSAGTASDSTGGAGVAIANTDYDALYQAETWVPASDSATFTFGVLNGDYSVHLHFVDWSINPTYAAGDRIFHVDLEGTRVLTSLDIIAEVGKDAALVRSFDVTVTNEELTLVLTSVVRWAEIAAVEIVPQNVPHLGDDNYPTTPTVATSAPTNITDDGATLGGNVTSDGGAAVTAKGVAYSTSSSPTLANSHTVDGSGVGGFTSVISSLEPQTVYFIRAYATNSQGTSYGNQVQFQTGSQTGDETGEPTYTGTAHYVSSTDGSDANDGLSPQTALATISQANTITLSPGDAILFKRGDSFEGTLNITESGNSTDKIVIGAYETGAKPILYGSRAIAGWSPYDGNIYRKAYGTEITQLFVDGQKMRLARHQDTDEYSFITSTPNIGGTVFTSNTIDGSINHIGATCYIRRGYYQSPVRQIVDQSNQTLTLSSGVGDTGLSLNNGFILMGKLEYLTTPGEWVYHNGYVYLWTPSGDSPDDYIVRGSVDAIGIDCHGTSHVSVLGLELLHQKNFGVLANSASHQLIEGNRFLYNEECGYKNVGANTNNIFRRNFFKGQNGLGIYTYHTTNVLVEENEFRDIGVFNEMGEMGHGEKDTWGSGFEISQPHPDYTGDPNLLFQYNEFYNMSYNGFFWRGKATVYRNFFQGISVNRQDGAGIYTNTQGNGSLVKENIVLDSVGEIYGYRTGRVFSNGIYVDESCENATIEYNTCINSGEAGIKLHNNRTSVVRYNHILNARTALNVLGRTDDAGVEKIDINHNTFVQSSRMDVDSYLDNTLLIWATNSSAEGSGSPQFVSNHNQLVYPFSGVEMFKEYSPYYSFSEWQGRGYDADSTLEQTALDSGESYQCFYNKSKVTKNYTVTGNNVKDVDQNPVSSFQLEPYRSLVLRGSNIVVTEL